MPTNRIKYDPILDSIADGVFYRIHVMPILLHHKYPGNIREFENILQHAFVLCRGSMIGKKHLPEYLVQPQIPNTIRSVDKESVEAVEKRNISV